MGLEDIAMDIIWYLTYLLAFGWFTSPDSAERVAIHGRKDGHASSPHQICPWMSI
jgi:hypothetical protein